MSKLDCLFLHVPKLNNYYRPIDQFLWINFIPMGLLAIADLLARHQISTEVVHLGLEWIEDRQFSILRYLREKTPRIVAFDLHWHHQCYDVMELVHKIKSEFPSTYILLGGYTASFFHEEIMKNFDSVDGVIRGEGEQPVLELVQTLLQGKGDLFSVPNLTWKRKGRILINPLSYVATEEDLNRLSFTHFHLLKNFQTYIHFIGQPFYVKGVSKERNFWIYSLRSPIYHLPLGRGCPVQCTWCGGGRSAQEILSGRKGVTFRGINKVIETIQEALSYGYETFHICFDPYPSKPEFFLELFHQIRKAKIRMECFFESFRLPTPDFIRSFKETFTSPKSLIALSPDVGSDRMRKLHKGYPYSNRDLMETLDQLKANGVFCDLFFTIGLPFETQKDIHEMIQLQRTIRSRYPNVRGIRTFTIEMEPGSPWSLHPETYGVKSHLHHFMDYYHYHSASHSSFSSLGYWIPGYLGNHQDAQSFEKALQKMKCQYFCFIHPIARRSSTPFWGRRLCDLSNLFWKTKKWVRK